MKSLRTNFIMAVAAMAVAAGSASAETLKADIPFTFRAGNTLLTPGAYKLKMSVSINRHFILMQNEDTGASVMLATFVQGDASKNLKAKRVPALAFVCDNARCALTELWTGGEASSYYFRTPHLGHDGDLRTAEIALTQVKAD
jgi:hypothetical protein